MSKRKPPQKAARKSSKSDSKKKIQSKKYLISADNVKAALEEFMRTRSLLRADETIYTLFPAIEIEIVKEVLN